MVVGTSAGAANALFLALYPDIESYKILEKAWLESSETELLPSNLIRITFYAFLNKAKKWSNKRLESFFISHLPNKDLRFGDLKKIRTYMIAADINSGKMIVFGDDPKEKVIDGLLATTAIPPWIRPVEKDGQFLIDGGIVSNLPVEPAIQRGATEIVAFDISETRLQDPDAAGFGPFFSKILITVGQRQTYLELEVAQAMGIPTHRLILRTDPPIPIWDFTHTKELLEKGYEMAKKFLKNLQLSTVKIQTKRK